MEKIEKRAEQEDTLLLNWNVRKSSEKNAGLKAQWILSTNAQIIILTEVGRLGGEVLREKLETNGYTVIFTPPVKDDDTDDRSVLIAAKGISLEQLSPELPFASNRIVPVMCTLRGAKVLIIGAYIQINNIEMQKWLMDMIRHCKEQNIKPIIVAGDLNIFENNPELKIKNPNSSDNEFYDFFKKYDLLDAYRVNDKKGLVNSWFGNGSTRIDYIFLSESISNWVVECSYSQETVEKSLSDHAAMILKLDVPVTE